MDGDHIFTKLILQDGDGKVLRPLSKPIVFREGQRIRLPKDFDSSCYSDPCGQGRSVHIRGDSIREGVYVVSGLPDMEYQFYGNMHAHLVITYRAERE